ncbi:MAG: DUF928 domain-containing protein [Leptolyngbya sp. RL_3_1]|nr:DUF928 domain-containing protein [Leptolyngbya sp. RL_3_1]
MMSRHGAIALLLTLTVLLGASPGIPGPVLAQSKSRPAPPRGLPPNRAQPGGGLDEALQSCGAEDALTALVPVNSPVLTTQAHPTFFFYIPDLPERVKTAQFSLLTADEKTRVYRTTVTLADTPGIISIQLPDSAETALELEAIYHWYFQLDCQSPTGESTPGFDLFVDGWVQRVAATPERQQQIAAGSPEIWHDVLAATAAAIAADPGSADLQARWLSLLATADLEVVSGAVLLGSATAIGHSSLR